MNDGTKFRQLCEDFQIAIAMVMDEENVQTIDEVEKCSNQLEDAVDYGLESARDRAGGYRGPEGPDDD